MKTHKPKQLYLNSLPHRITVQFHLTSIANNNNSNPFKPSSSSIINKKNACINWITCIYTYLFQIKVYAASTHRASLTEQSSLQITKQPSLKYKLELNAIYQNTTIYIYHIRLGGYDYAHDYCWLALMLWRFFSRIIITSTATNNWFSSSLIGI